MIDLCMWCRIPVEQTCENPAPFCDLCQQINTFVVEMDVLRSVKKYEVADGIRKGLTEMGIVVENGPRGSLWRWKNYRRAFAIRELRT